LKRFVLDASIALAWFLDQPIAPIASKARRALIDGSRAMVPALCPFEIANGFAVAERRALITEPEANQSLLELDHLLVQAIDISNEMILAPRLLTLARAFDFLLTMLLSWRQRKQKDFLWLLWISRCDPPRSELGLQFSASNTHFKYSESFFKSGGIGGNGGNSCDEPLNSATVVSARKFPF
jgi:hypothetical protein